MKKLINTLSLATACVLMQGCNTGNVSRNDMNVRQMVDTVGFAHINWQEDSIINRIERTYTKELSEVKIDDKTSWRVAICPHDDYTYASWQYPALLRNLKAKTVIIFGVAHKARQLNVSDMIVFDSYSHWNGPYKDIKVSPIREELMAAMPKELYQVNDSLQKVEHSVESMLPFVQHFNRDVEIISILVPFMNTEKMAEISKHLSSAIAKVMNRNNLEWGRDIALLITTDAVHYGDEDWGGKNMAPYGVDSIGYAKAVMHEHGIIDSCLVGEPNLEKVKRFIDFTVQPNNYKEYKWTWCGRYSVPLGLMTALNLQKELNSDPLNGIFIGYSTSIDHKPLPVDDLRMGKTAIATIRHWVGYASVGYR
ncbi:MAG: AmmeMemoRadiSam system protein B [Bacteroidales bacterium]|nr:MAG: AmmeMemoRadiSam system protein B [Bacteroidales bacterium]